jgi:putative ABC transport system permease protein
MSAKRAGIMSASTFRLLGVPPLLGRTFTDDEDLESAAPSVILGYSVWQTRYGGQPSVVGILGNQVWQFAGCWFPAFQLECHVLVPR